MGLVRFVQGGAQFVDDLGQALTAPGREREKASRRAEESKRKTEAKDAAQRSRDEAVAQGQVTAQLAEVARPGQEKTADSVFTRTQAGLDNETGRQITVMGAQADQAGQILGVVDKANVNKVDAEARGDVTRQQGYRENILTPQKEILGMTQAHDLATQRNFIGDTPLTPQLLAENDKDRALALELDDRMRQDPMRWVDTAAKLAATAGLIFA